MKYEQPTIEVSTLCTESITTNPGGSTGVISGSFED